MLFPVGLDSFKRVDARGNVIHQPPNHSPSEEDTIVIIQEEGAVPNDSVEIGLQAGQDVTWWKGINFYPSSAGYGSNLEPAGEVEAALGTENTPAIPLFIRLPFRAVNSRGGRKGMVVLAKAKELGRHRDYYMMGIGEVLNHPGTRFTFRWDKDHG